jgi:membrane protein DedA with SNARE-associated domain
MANFDHTLIAFIAAHPAWAMLVIGITAFGESFAFIGIIFPGTTVLVAEGALVGTGVLNPVTTIIAGSIGAILGDGVSFWIGQKFAPAIANQWPFRTRPEMLLRGIHFFERFGWASIFIGRFFGPLRAVVTIAAGMMKMPVVPFYIANCLSAIIWAPAIVFSGALLGGVLSSGWSAEGKITIIAVAAAILLAALYGAKRLLGVQSD